MWLELEALRARNAELEEKRVPPPAVKGNEKKPLHTLQDLRSKKSLTERVHKFLATFEDSSTDEDSDEKDNTCTSRGRCHTLKSGKDGTLTSQVLAPQLWPHSHFSSMYVSKDKKYDDLSLSEFPAGYTAILQHHTLSSSELRTPIDHLSVLMYLATQYSWPSVRDLHTAVLYEIKCGRTSWGDSFGYLESGILQAPLRSSRQGPTRSGSSSGVFFCRDYQHGVCKLKKDQYGTLRGEQKWLQHIYADAGWVPESRCITPSS